MCSRLHQFFPWNPNDSVNLLRMFGSFYLTYFSKSIRGLTQVDAKISATRWWYYYETSYFKNIVSIFGNNAYNYRIVV